MFYSHNPFLNDATEEKGKLTFILFLKVKKIFEIMFKRLLEVWFKFLIGFK